MDTQTIKNMIEDALPDATVDVDGEDGVHFRAQVISATFAGKLPLARHRLVHDALGDRLGGDIHALSLKTLTPDEHAGPSGQG